jgi:hypothetical protein
MCDLTHLADVEMSGKMRRNRYEAQTRPLDLGEKRGRVLVATRRRIVEKGRLAIKPRELRLVTVNLLCRARSITMSWKQSSFRLDDAQLDATRPEKKF